MRLFQRQHTRKVNQSSIDFFCGSGGFVLGLSPASQRVKSLSRDIPIRFVGVHSGGQRVAAKSYHLPGHHRDRRKVRTVRLASKMNVYAKAHEPMKPAIFMSRNYFHGGDI